MVLTFGFDEMECLLEVNKALIDNERAAQPGDIETAYYESSDYCAKMIAMELLLILTNACLEAARHQLPEVTCELDVLQRGFMRHLIEPIKDVLPPGLWEKFPRIDLTRRDGVDEFTVTGPVGSDDYLAAMPLYKSDRILWDIAPGGTSELSEVDLVKIIECETRAITAAGVCKKALVFRSDRDLLTDKAYAVQEACRCCLSRKVFDDPGAARAWLNN
jgi:hypothetical protein